MEMRYVDGLLLGQEDLYRYIRSEEQACLDDGECGMERG
jgi:hypothetical protein